MDGTVTISIDDFEMLRKCEKAFNKMYKALSKCDFADETGTTVPYEPVYEAISAMMEV